MIGYVTIGTNDLAKSKTYYDALLHEFGGKPAWSSDRMHGYAGPHGMVAICTPHDGKPASPGNGQMFAFPAKDHAMVDAVYAKAMKLGSKDEGAPGARGDNF